MVKNDSYKFEIRANTSLCTCTPHYDDVGLPQKLFSLEPDYECPEHFPSPEEVTLQEDLETRVALMLEQHGLLTCSRDWSAWGVKTMSSEDFDEACDDLEVVAVMAESMRELLERAWVLGTQAPRNAKNRHNPYELSPKKKEK